MQKFIGTKILFAIAMTLGEYNTKRGWPMPADEDPQTEGYLVEYTDGGKPNHPAHNGYISWSPKEQFERAYRPYGGMTFGHAVEALKAGKRVCRSAWNGKGMYLWLLPAAMVIAEWCREPHLKEVAETNGGEIEALGSIRMMTADRKVLTGWLATQTDILAEDWTVLD